MIRVVVADDQALMRTALEHFVAQAEDLEVVGSAEDGVQALEAARTLAPDVVLMDMQMPHMDGVEATARISAEAPGVRVLAITTFSSEQYLVPALRAGAAGYLVKDAPPAEVVDAIRRVHAGDAVFSARLFADLVEAVTAAPSTPTPARPSPSPRTSASPSASWTWSASSPRAPPTRRSPTPCSSRRPR